MDLRSFEAALPRNAGDDLPHLSGPAADVRQVLAAHFVRDCPHIVEIGGHRKPITGFLTHAPLSVLSVDPKTPDHCAGSSGAAPAGAGMAGRSSRTSASSSSRAAMG